MGPKRLGDRVTYGSLVSSQSASREEVSQVAGSSHLVLLSIVEDISHSLFKCLHSAKFQLSFQATALPLQMIHWNYLLILDFS